MRKTQIASIALAALSFVVAFILYPALPDRVAVHWNAAGVADGFSGKWMGAYLLPILSVFLLGLFYALPYIDPMRKNYGKFQSEYDWMALSAVAFLLYVYALSLAANLGREFNMSAALAPGFAALFYAIGGVVEKAKQNWFVGIRTPWTLSSERVWEKTHRICGKMFKAAGIVALIGIFLPAAGMAASIGVVVAMAIFSFVYSYYEYAKEMKGKKRGGRKI